jgi:hypothetical protein
MQGAKIGWFFIENLAIEKIGLVQKTFLMNLKSFLELNPGRALPYRHCAPLHELTASLSSDRVARQCFAISHFFMRVPSIGRPVFRSLTFTYTIDLIDLFSADPDAAVQIGYWLADQFGEARDIGKGPTATMRV